MINVLNPNKSDWKSLVKRPYFNNKSIVKTVSEVFKNVKKNGDASIKNYTFKFDKIKNDVIKVEKKNNF